MKLIKIYIVIFILMIFNACDEDLLELYPITSKTEGNFYQNITEINQAVNDVYRLLGNHYNITGSGGWDYPGLPDLYGELYSDNTCIILTSGLAGELQDITDFRIRSSNNYISFAWDQCYNAIFILNNILYRLEQTTLVIDEPTLNAMKGQAILVRSLIYFNMVRAFGAIPYIDKKITTLESYDYLRVDPSIIYDNLITDLTYAKQVLPDSWTGNDIGRVTKYGSSAILAKVYLTLGDNNKAKSELEFIMNSNRFSLDANNDGTIDVNDYFHIFHWDTKNCKSSVLEVQYKSGDNAFNSRHANMYAPFNIAFQPPLPWIGKMERGYGFNTPTDELAEEFEQNDPRQETSVYPGFYHSVTGEFIKYPFTMKFFDPNWSNKGHNICVIRYADILLMYAEVTNDPQYLNQVRSRADMPAYGTEGYPSDKYPTLALAIEHERRVELCFEFHRFFDLVRTGRALEVIQSKGYEINENKLLFPIPLEAIDVHKKLTQNPGY